jgi:hypothetical protein
LINNNIFRLIHKIDINTKNYDNSKNMIDNIILLWRWNQNKIKETIFRSKHLRKEKVKSNKAKH